MTVGVSQEYNSMNAQEGSNDATCCPKGGAELDYGNDEQAGFTGRSQQLPIVKAKKGSWPDTDEDTTETENGETDSCSEEPPSMFAPVGATQEHTPLENEPSGNVQELRPFSYEETLFIFDWDDTILPSAWVQSQGLRLDEESKLNDFQRQQLSQVANLAMETIRSAKQHGTVVLVTNAERGWIELSCQKFLPTLFPTLENLKLVSARTTYESRENPTGLDWKLCAFKSEIWRVFGDEAMSDPSIRKNVLSLGDSMHEREALLRSTAALPNCHAKSLKFVERPDINEICKQHSLIAGCFERIVHHDGNLDMCIRCS